MKSMIDLKFYGEIFRNWGGNCPHCSPGYAPDWGFSIRRKKVRHSGLYEFHAIFHSIRIYVKGEFSFLISNPAKGDTA